MASVDFLFIKEIHKNRFFHISQCKTCTNLVFLDELMNHVVCNCFDLKPHGHYLYMTGGTRYKK